MLRIAPRNFAKFFIENSFFPCCPPLSARTFSPISWCVIYLPERAVSP
jgi:hypothetical protein